MNLAFLGTGIMGEPMVRNLLRAGHHVRTWNRTREKAEPLARDGATIAATPAEAVAGVEVVVTMLADGPAVESVMGEAAPAARGAAWWQASTVGIAAHERLAALAAEHDLGIVDGPVLGTKGPAEQGKLVVLASGEDAAVECCTPLFEAVAAKTIRLGAAGEGTRLKLVLNHWIAGLVELLGETVALAEAIDVDPALFLSTIAGSPLDSGYAQMKGKAMLERSYDPSFTLALATKDVRLVLEAAGRAGLSLGLAPAVAERFEAAIEAGHGDQDLAACVEASRLR